jgi:hypothetical protein
VKCGTDLPQTPYSLALLRITNKQSRVISQIPSHMELQSELNDVCVLDFEGIACLQGYFRRVGMLFTSATQLKCSSVIL